MQILKKSLSILLCIMMVFSLVAVNASAEATVQADFTFEISEAGEAMVTAYNGTATDVVIPSEVTIEDVTYPVTAVGDKVFAGGDFKIVDTTGDTVTSIVFPESVVSIGTSACENNTNLVSVTINGSGVTLIKRFARGCSNLTQLTINGYIKTLGGQDFMNSGLTTIVLPEGLETIGDYAFNSAKITAIHLPSSVTTITGEHVLYGSQGVLKDLLTIYVPDTKTEAIVREGCKATYTVSGTEGVYVYRWKMVVGDGYESNPAYWPGGNGVVNGYTGSAAKVVVPTYAYDYSKITTLNAGFANGNATEIIIPETVVLSITAFRDNKTTNLEKLIINCDITGDASFRNCTSLKEVVINGTIAASYIFNGCSALGKATINTVSAETANQNVFMNNAALTEITVTGIIPDGTADMIQAASVPNLKKLIIAETGGFSSETAGANKQFAPVRNQLTEIEIHGTIDKSNCFLSFPGLKTVKIYKTAKLTQVQIFRACTGIENIIFEEGTTIASGNCFQGCTGIKKLEIARNVTFDSYAIFNGCTGIETIDLKAGVNCTPNSTNIFTGCTGLKHMLVRDGAVDIHMGNTANTNIVTYYMPTWWDGLSMRGGACATNSELKTGARTCYVDEDVVLADVGENYLVPSKEGYIFTDFVTTVDGKEVWYAKDQSQVVGSFRPKFVKAVGGDVNGDHNVNVFDLVRYKRYLADALGEAPNTVPFITQLADLTADSDYTADDLAVVRQMLLGKNDYASVINEKYSAFNIDEILTLADMDVEPVVSEVQFYDEEYAYNHHPHITKFDGIYYAIYSQGYANEDDLGQRVMYAVSEDGIEWNIPDVLSDTCTGTLYPEQKTVQFPLGFFNNGEKLYVYYVIKEIDPESVTENGAYDYVVAGMTYYYKELVNGEWSEPVALESPVGSYENAKYYNGVYYTTTATGIRRSTDGINWVTRGLTNEQIAMAVENGAKSLAEGTLYLTDNYMLHLFMRGGDGYIWHSVSTDGGNTWSDAYRTALTNDNSKLYVGQLDDGRYFVVSNPVYSATGARNPLCISISDDGYDFSSTYIIRGGEGEDYELIQPGIAKGGSYAYPSCYVDGDTIYIIYSCGKEIIEVVSFDVSSLI